MRSFTTHVSTLAVSLFLFACGSSSPDSPMELDATSSTDASVDAFPMDQEVQDMAFDQGMEPDVAVDANVEPRPDMTSDVGTQPDASVSPNMDRGPSPDAGQEDAAVPPGPCPDDDTITCASLCDQLVSCFTGDTCLGVDQADQATLQIACEESCGFNTTTRDVMCRSPQDTCATIIERISESDPALGTLCSDEFPDADRTACANICARTTECLGDNNDSEHAESCVIQCLVTGANAVSECVVDLECDQEFEGRVQACLQGRRFYPQLNTSCASLCGTLSACTPSQADVFGMTNMTDTCETNCSNQLSTASAIACAGLSNCSLNSEIVSMCEAANSPAPSCRLSCHRIAECSASNNRFGLTDEQFSRCVQECAQSGNPDERQCVFAVACDENFLENVGNCIENNTP